uniref:Uncharacterized protein n=1 Tax=Lygus hesperus TaxID=30085 RepID=A0A0A9Z8M8_LYGHE
MNTNKYQSRSGDSPLYHDRDKWLDDLQRHFSADLEQKSEVMYNSNPHVEGCSSESEEDASIYHPGVRNNSSFYTPCSGAVPKTGRRASTGDRLDDLYRVVKLHSQQLNLLQNQIKSLVKVLQCSCKADIKDELQNNIQQCLGTSLLTTTNKLSDNVDDNRLDVRSDSDVVPKCVFNPDLIASTDESERNFFSTVMGTLRGMLVDSDLENSTHNVDDSDPDTDDTDKTRLNATLEQLKRLGVSFIEKVPDKKKVTFCESARTESSVEIDSLARKYLVQKQKVDAFDHIQTMQKKTTDLSLATIKYLQRYKLSKDGKKTDEPGKHRSRRRSHDDLEEMMDRRNESPVAGKILDSVAIRSQPKLSPKKQWLLRRD